MAEGAGIGVVLEPGDIPTLFGEDQARYLIACTASGTTAIAAAAGIAGVPCAVVGRFGGDMVQLGAAGQPLAGLSALYRGAFAKAVA